MEISQAILQKKKKNLKNREAGPNTHKHSPQGLDAVKSIW